MSDWEVAARQICFVQGSDPDALVDGRPAWLDWVAEAALLLRKQGGAQPAPRSSDAQGR